MAQKVLILGRGLSGRSAEKLLGRLGYETQTLDGDDVFPGGDFAFAVASPGIALSHPWMRECAVRGVEVESELQLGCAELKRRGWKLLAVTGSKGKSSVVKVVAEAISATGATAVACGNYGRAVSEVALGGPPGWAVVEVSSFQLETTRLPPDTFEAAAVLNLQADHLDRHVSPDVYHALKRSLLTMAKLRFSEGDAQHEALLFAGSYFDNEVLRSNGALAVSLMRAAGLGDGEIKEAFASFVPLPHRMNLVLERGGVRYVDDSKATSLAATAAALRMTGSNVRLIAGGLAKGDDPRSILPDLTKRVKKVYLIGRCAEAFYNVWSDFADCEICGFLERAVMNAKREARAGETVLLSPGCASYDQFENFGRRGEAFVRFAEKEG